MGTFASGEYPDEMQQNALFARIKSAVVCKPHYEYICKYNHATSILAKAFSMKANLVV